MESIKQKLERNIQEGTFFRNGSSAIKNRFFKYIRSMNLIYFLDKNRIKTKKYQSTIKKVGTNGVKVGNYYLDSRIPLNESSIVYSLGILTDISFDLSIQKQFGCDVFMYDPTPSCIEFMKKYAANTGLKFNPIGVWVEGEILKFYQPKLGGSFTLIRGNDSTDEYFEAKCETMETIMQNNKHTEISVFKADIEGAALPILKQMIDEKIFPDQIVAEFERPKKGEDKIQEFFESLTELRSKLKDADYEEFLLPRKEAKYYSLEILFVKKSKIL